MREAFLWLLPWIVVKVLFLLVLHLTLFILLLLLLLFSLLLFRNNFSLKRVNFRPYEITFQVSCGSEGNKWGRWKTLTYLSAYKNCFFLITWDKFLNVGLYVNTNEAPFTFLPLFSSLGVSLRVFSACSLIRLSEYPLLQNQILSLQRAH